MADEQETAVARLKKLQQGSGAWPWFEGMPDDRFITQYIAIGFGRLFHLGVLDPQANSDLQNMVGRCLNYLDDRIENDYKELMRCCMADLDKNHLGELQIQYLYMRSFFKDVPVEERSQNAFPAFIMAKQKNTGLKTVDIYRR